MKHHQFISQLKLSAASFAVLCVMNTGQAYASTSEAPTCCSFVFPDKWHCCWDENTPVFDYTKECTASNLSSSATCADLSPPTPSPTPSPGPTTTPGPTTAVPTNAPTPSPCPPPTVCPADFGQTLNGSSLNFSNLASFSGLTLDLKGTGILMTPNATAQAECGKDYNGNVRLCTNRELGAITKHCVIAGYDPPPLLIPGMAINTLFGPGNWSPFKKVATAGVTSSFTGANTTTLAGTCSLPFVANGNGTMTSQANPSTNSRIKCNVFTGGANVPTNVVSQPPNQRCVDASMNPIQCQSPSMTCDAPPYPPECTDPDGAPPCLTNVTNLPSGCGAVSYAGAPATSVDFYCHTDISATPQYCPGGPACASNVPAAGAYSIPGFVCGGAIPLVDPLDFNNELGITMQESCPPADWCVKPPVSSTFRDGAIHIASDAANAAAGIYNVTIKMGELIPPATPGVYTGPASLRSLNSTRTYTLPEMGACALNPGSTQGTLVLSNAFPYLIVPASIIVPSPPPTPGPAAGTKCYGQTCNYDVKPPSSIVPAEWPVTFSSAYKPYGAVTTPAPELYDGDPANPDTTGVTLPLIEVPPDGTVSFSLKVPGTIYLPDGGSISTPNGGSITIPEYGKIRSVGDGSTVDLGIGASYYLGGPVANPSAPANSDQSDTVATSPCYVQIIPDANATTSAQLRCKTSLPPVIPPTSVPNPSIIIKTSQVRVLGGVALPVTTSRKAPCTTSPPAVDTINGNTIGPGICWPPEKLDPSTHSCVTPVASCDCSTSQPNSCTLLFDTVNPSNGTVVSTGDVSTALSATDLATYNTYLAAGDTANANKFLLSNMLPNVMIHSTCSAVSTTGTPSTAPVVCSPSSFTFSTSVGGCLPGTSGAALNCANTPSDPACAAAYPNPAPQDCTGQAPVGNSACHAYAPYMDPSGLCCENMTCDTTQTPPTWVYSGLCESH